MGLKVSSAYLSLGVMPGDAAAAEVAFRTAACEAAKQALIAVMATHAAEGRPLKEAVEEAYMPVWMAGVEEIDRRLAKIGDHRNDPMIAFRVLHSALSSLLERTPPRDDQGPRDNQEPW